MQSHTDCICLVLFHCAFSSVFSNCQFEKKQNCIALVVVVWLFSSVCFQMRPQMACPRRCIVTLATFVWLFPTVSFQMCPQIGCLNRCKVALIALVCFSPEWVFKCVLKLPTCKDLKSHWLHIFGFSPLRCEFSNVTSKRLHKRMHSRAQNLWNFGCRAITINGIW